MKIKKISVVVVSLFAYLVTFATYASTKCRINELYIEAAGNNKYEAEIKANDLGMYRALLMLGTQLNISNDAIAKVPYPELARVFIPVAVKGIDSIDTHYSATVDYQYNLHSLHELLLQYGNQEVKNLFYAYLIIPILKQKSVVYLWNDNYKWNEQWSNNRVLLDQNKLLYPHVTLELTNAINSQNIFNLTYDDILAVLPNVLFKKVLLVVCEYFTNINTGAAVMNIKYINLSHNEQNITSKDYPLSNLNEVITTMNQALIDTIRNYGQFNGNELALEHSVSANEHAPVVQIDKTKVIEDNERRLTFDFEVFSSEDLQHIKNKLANVKEVINFEIMHDYDVKYKAIILTESNDYELAKGFYLNGLSFRIQGKRYSLIDVIQEGI